MVAFNFSLILMSVFAAMTANAMPLFGTGQNKYARLVEDDNKGWHVGNRAVENDLVDKGNDSWTVHGDAARAAPTAAVTGPAVDTDNTDWSIGGKKPNVGRALGQDLEDSNDHWTVGNRALGPVDYNNDHWTIGNKPAATQTVA